MSIEENQTEHAKISSWFLGPRAENFDALSGIFDKVLTDQSIARRNLYPKDPDFITQEMKDLDVYKASIDALGKSAGDLSAKLATHSVPFWSPRYNAHMNMDTAMSSIIGCKQTSALLFLTQRCQDPFLAC